MRKQHSPTLLAEPVLSIIPRSKLITMPRDELLKVAAEMLKYLDPPAEPGPWAIALINFQTVDAVREEIETK